MTGTDAWVFDLGNSRLKFAALEPGGRLGDMAAVPHAQEAFAAGWQSALPTRIGCAWIASVGPPGLLQQLSAALESRGARIGMASTMPHFAGITIAYARPERLGVDRLLAMAAARARDPSPALVVGVGTALTLDLVDAEGRHRGGRIAPSPSLMREALQRRAPHLPLDDGEYVEFGVDTAAALASGCVGAAMGLVERSRRQARALLGTEPRIWLHGGGVATLPEPLEGATHAPALVLEGLALWARRETGDPAPSLG